MKPLVFAAVALVVVWLTFLSSSLTLKQPERTARGQRVWPPIDRWDEARELEKVAGYKEAVDNVLAIPDPHRQKRKAAQHGRKAGDGNEGAGDARNEQGKYAQQQEEEEEGSTGATRNEQEKDTRAAQDAAQQQEAEEGAEGGTGAFEKDDDSAEDDARTQSKQAQAHGAQQQKVPALDAAPWAQLIAAPPLDLADTTLLGKCPHHFSDAEHNVQWVKRLTAIFARLKVHWWLDEGGLIGAARAGSMNNADDDFDFFALLPNQLHPCHADSRTCTADEFNTMIHSFLSELWKEGLCVNNFHPDVTKYDSKRKLMYSLMLDRNTVHQPNAKTPGARCFEHGKSPRFAHMHLAMLTEDGRLATNIWATGHKHDKIPVEVVLPATRCRTGFVEAPCPQNIPLFLKMRNEGEYNKSSSQGQCLLVRKKWSAKKKQEIIRLTEQLHSCGYNSMYDLIQPAIASDYTQC